MYQLKYDFVGKAGGNFRPQYNEPEQSFFLENLEYQLNLRGIPKVFAPRCNFSTNVGKLGYAGQYELMPWLTRTESGVDGGYVAKPDIAIAIFNADCPVIILFDKEAGRLALLHAGFRCLVPENKHDLSIVEKAFKNTDLNPATVDAFIGFGAGPCCYGAEHHNEIHRREIYNDCVQVARKGPRQEQLSLNLPYLIRNRLLDCGVRDGAISYDFKCTACAGRENGSEGAYHSNIYEGKDAGRNLVLAWFKTV